MTINFWNTCSPRTKFITMGMGIVLAAAVIAVLSSAPARLTKKLDVTGFTFSTIDSLKIRPGLLSLKGISLDVDGFSMIGALTAQGNPLFPLAGTPSRVTLDNLQLTGEWNEELGLNFAGWSVPRKKDNIGVLAGLDRLILEDGIIDLDTPVGALRFALKGEAARHPEQKDRYYLGASLSGKQHQVSIDSQIKGQWDTDGNIILESEIRDGRVNTEHLSASRVSGWMALEIKAGEPVPGISGQIQAGQFTRDTLSLNNASLTLDGSMIRPHVILSAELGSHQSSSLMVELQGQNEGTHVLASIETVSLDNLVSILAELRKQAEISPFAQDALMTLLITEGNIDRVKRDLKKESYDSYVLEIEGLMDDLKGKVIAKRLKDGVMQREIVSLNPSVAAGAN